MLDLVARKSVFGQVCINKAKIHLARHEWGLARLAIEDGIAKGGLNDPGAVDQMVQDIRMRLGWSELSLPHKRELVCTKD